MLSKKKKAIPLLALKSLIFFALFWTNNIFAETYIFVSHSMSDSALQAYFNQAKEKGATLVLRGLIDDSFMATKAKCEQLKISYDINPILFDEFNIKSVPAIVKVESNIVKKVTGHIPLDEAFRIFAEETL